MSGNSTQPVFPRSLFNEYTIAVEGSFVACILYGIYLTIAARNIYLLYKRRYKALWLFALLQLVNTTLYIAISLYSAPSQCLGIFPIFDTAGPDSLSPWPAIVVNSAFILNMWASDGFLLFRCYVVCMRNKLALAFPALLYVATVGSSLAMVVYSTTPGAVYSTYSVQVTGILFWTLSAAMNICVTLIILTRIQMHRRVIVEKIGVSHGEPCHGYTSVMLESAMLYTVFVIVALVMFAINSPLENVFFPVLGVVQVIAPSLIIYRIVVGASFETDEYGSAGREIMTFASSGQLGVIVETTHQETNEPGTDHVFTRHRGKMGRQSGFDQPSSGVSERGV